MVVTRTNELNATFLEVSGLTDSKLPVQTDIPTLDTDPSLTDFYLTAIADTAPSSPFTGLKIDSAPALNNSGTVTFFGFTRQFISPQTFSSSDSIFNIFIGQGAAPVTFLPGGFFRDSVIGSPDINNQGDITFARVSRIIRSEINVIRNGVLSSYNPGFGLLTPSMNESGKVATLGAAFEIGTPKAIFATTSALLNPNPPFTTRIARVNSGRFPFFTDLGAPSLNNADLIAFTAVETLSGGDRHTIQISDLQANLTTRVDDSGIFQSFGDLTLNDNNELAFAATLDTGDRGVFRSHGDTFQTLVSSVTSDFERFHHIGLNNQNNVAFLGDRVGGGESLVFVAGTTLIPVIATGDRLLGSTVVDLNFTRDGLNDQNQLAFYARLENGREGIFRAEPVRLRVVIGEDIQRETGDHRVITGDGDDRIAIADGGNQIFAGEGDNGIAIGMRDVHFSAIAPWISAFPISFTHEATGNNRIVTGDGNNFIGIAGENNQVFTGDGINQIVIERGGNTVHTGDNTDYITIGFDNAKIADIDFASRLPNISIQGSTVNTGRGNDRIVMGSGDDRVNAGEGDNVIQDSDGDNIILSRAGNDWILLGKGSDRVLAGNGNNLIVAGDGKNQVYTGDGNDTITTGAGNDLIKAGEGVNLITSGDGNNRIIGGSEIDVIYAGSGDDTIFAGDGNNTIRAGDGSNWVQFGAGTTSVYTGEGSDRIFAGDGIHNILTGGGDDLIWGGAGSNNITPGTGNDFVGVRAGSNSIDLQGTGNDTVFLAGGQDQISLWAGDGAATIWNYSASTKLQLNYNLRDASISVSQVGNDTQIISTETQDLLAILKGTVAADVTITSNF